MTIIGFNVPLFAFWTLPFISAVVHRKVGKRWTIFLLLIAYATLGWLLLFGALAWNDAQWSALLDRTPNPSEELMEQFNSDGASRAFTLLFGWPTSFLYVSSGWGISRGIGWIVRKALA